MTDPSQPPVRALPLTNPSSMTSWSPKRHRPPPNHRALTMMTCSLNQSKPNLSIKMTYSHFNFACAASLSAGRHKKNTYAVNTPKPASHTGSARNDDSTKEAGPWNSSPTRSSTLLAGATKIAPSKNLPNSTGPTVNQPMTAEGIANKISG